MSTIIYRRPYLGSVTTARIAASIPGTRALMTERQLPRDTELVIRWGTTARLGRNIPVINSAEAISLGANKKEARRALAATGVTPRTWFDLEDWFEYIDPMLLAGNEGPLALNSTYIVRPARHAQGRHLFVCNTTQEVADACRACGDNNYYISEYIPKVAEYRVYVFQGRAGFVEQKIPGNPDAIAWNEHQGSRFRVVNWDNWPLNAVKKAIIATNTIGLDFAGVDVIIDGHGKGYVLELNSGPTVTGDYTSSTFAKLLRYMVENGKNRIPLIQERGGYRKFIHPAMTDRALIP